MKIKTAALAVCLVFSSALLAEGNGGSYPSASHIMIEVGERYQNLYWAAKLGQWQFAEYQLEELQKQIELLQKAQPKFAPTAETFLARGLEGYGEAFQARDWTKFERAFGNMRAQCLACHGRNDHGFIVPPAAPATATSPILNLPGAR